jgi:hypothetical protein
MAIFASQNKHFFDFSGLALSFLIAAVLWGTAGAQNAPTSHFVTIDAPDAGSTGTLAEFINRNGTALGIYYDASQRTHGFFLPARGTLVEFDPPNSTQTIPTAINSFNQIVGLAKINQKFVSFLRSGSGKYVILSLPGAINFTANAINDSQQIAGWYTDSSNVSHGYIRQADGTFTFLDEPDAASLGTFVNAMNNSGAVTGYYYDSQFSSHGFVRDVAGNYLSFDAPHGIGTTSGSKINDAGTVIATYGTSEGIGSVERDSLGSIQAISIPGADSTVVLGINNLDEIVGVAESNLGSNQVAFRRTASGNYSAMKIPVPHTTSWGQDVNDSGSVAGFYQDPSGKNFGFVLKP